MVGHKSPLSTVNMSIISSHPLFHRLSLLELVLDMSVLMVLSRMSPSSVLEDIDTSPAKRIQGWSRICSRVGLSEGRNDRHHLISCWHSGRRERKGENMNEYFILWENLKREIEVYRNTQENKKEMSV